jgi:uncharacterized NAD-dependent epimerase/dehydratase family protein
VVAVLDSTRAGRTAHECVGVGGDLPVVGDLDDAHRLGAEALLVGIAPQGGELPAPFRAVVLGALERGWDVFSGLHVFLGDDPELAERARARGATLWDVRRPPVRRPVAAARAARLEIPVVLTVGSDCNVGKMTAALELRAGLERAGCRAAFVATGQTGIFVSDRGVAVDAVPADFVAGVVEDLVLEAARDADVIVVEGQGALRHPGYSGVTLALLHGAAPSALVLCHQAGRDRLRTADDRSGAAIPPLAELVREYESAAAWVRPAAVLGIALHTATLDETAARAAVAAAALQTGLPASDPVRFGVEPLVAAVLARRARGRNHATAS